MKKQRYAVKMIPRVIPFNLKTTKWLRARAREQAVSIVYVVQQIVDRAANKTLQ